VRINARQNLIRWEVGRRRKTHPVCAWKSVSRELSVCAARVSAADRAHIWASMRTCEAAGRATKARRGWAPSRRAFVVHDANSPRKIEGGESVSGSRTLRDC
jgi:hypothetical protein